MIDPASIPMHIRWHRTPDHLNITCLNCQAHEVLIRFVIDETKYLLEFTKNHASCAYLRTS